MPSPNLKLKCALLASDFKQCRVADRVAQEQGIPFTPLGLSKIVGGWTRPHPEVRAALASILGVPESELFEEEGAVPMAEA